MRTAERALPLETKARQAAAAWENRGYGAGAGRASLRPELEFVFRTLVEVPVDMDQLRREFEAYREKVDDRTLYRKIKKNGIEV